MLSNMTCRTSIPKYRYYTNQFLVNNIKKSKERIRILCVRNLKITESDVIEELIKFVEGGGTVELFSLSPEATDDIIAEINRTLPKEAQNPEEFRAEIRKSMSDIAREREKLGANKEKFRYFLYKRMPLLHVCQFDNSIFMGLPSFNKFKRENTILDYCISVKNGHELGDIITEQLNYIRDCSEQVNFDNDSAFKKKKYMSGHKSNNIGDNASGIIVLAQDRATVTVAHNNVTISNEHAIFQELRGVTESAIDNKIERSKILEVINKMENKSNTNDFTYYYKEFMSLASNHLTVFTPLLPALAAFLC